jgi:hypothetical protein
LEFTASSTSNSISQADSSVTVTDTGSGTLDFTADSRVVAKYKATSYGASLTHAYWYTGLDTSRLSLVAGDGATNVPRFQLLGDADTGFPGLVAIDYGSTDKNLNSFFKVRFSDVVGGAEQPIIEGYKSDYLLFGGSSTSTAPVYFDFLNDEVRFRVPVIVEAGLVIPEYNSNYTEYITSTPTTFTPTAADHNILITWAGAADVTLTFEEITAATTYPVVITMGSPLTLGTTDLIFDPATGDSFKIDIDASSVSGGVSTNVNLSSVVTVVRAGQTIICRPGLVGTAGTWYCSD